ncbi:MAG: DUF4012 domain-containing protein [Actinomycetota bacterium]
MRRTTTTRHPLRRVLLGVVVLALVVSGSAAIVVQRTIKDLRAARAILAHGAGDLDSGDLGIAIDHLEAVRDRLDSIPGRLIRSIPVLRQNLAAIDDVATHAVPILKGATGMVQLLKSDGSLLSEGAFDLDRIERAADLAEETKTALGRLEAALERHRSGWLVPPVWSTIGELGARVRTARTEAARASALLSQAPALLGSSGERTYLILVLNNSELRGAGGILSAIGRASIRDGAFKVGSFDYYGELSKRFPEAERVPSPAEFRRRYSRYEADTTRFVNSTMSPDVPDVALVVSRLYRKALGIETDGAFIVDPHGLVALMPADTRISIPGSKETLVPAQLPDFVYSTVYTKFEYDQDQRRKFLLSTGKKAFSSFGSGMGTMDLSAVARAVGGGHLRFVSFDRGENEALSQAGVNGDLSTDADDSVFVTVQNFGGDKLDYWADRSMRHSCTLPDPTSAVCSTEVSLSNIAPKSLPEYVTQGKSRALHESFVEIYVPASAEITEVTRDDEGVNYSRARDDGRVAAGVFVEIPRGDDTRFRVEYELPVTGSGFSMQILPQPLARPAMLDVRLQVPAEWTFSDGPGSRTGPHLTYSGELDTRMTFEALPSEEGPSGISSLWGQFRSLWTSLAG